VLKVPSLLNRKLPLGDVRLMLLCRQIYIEASTLFYRINSFRGSHIAQRGATVSTRTQLINPSTTASVIETLCPFYLSNETVAVPSKDYNAVELYHVMISSHQPKYANGARSAEARQMNSPFLQMPLGSRIASTALCSNRIHARV
jgi:hypothetical protein